MDGTGPNTVRAHLRKSWSMPISTANLEKKPHPCGFVSGHWTIIITIFQSQLTFKCSKTWMTVNPSAFRREEVKQRRLPLFYHLWDEKQKVPMRFFLFLYKTAFHLIDLFVSQILNLLTPDVLCEMRGKKILIFCPAGVCMAKALTNIHTVFTHPPEARTFWESCNHSLI